MATMLIHQPDNGILAYEPFYTVGPRGQLTRMGGEVFNRCGTRGTNLDVFFTQLDKDPKKALAFDCDTVRRYGRSRQALHGHIGTGALDTVNVMLGSLTNGNVVRTLDAAIQDAGLSYKSVTAEISEVKNPLLRKDWRLVSRHLGKLRDRGLGVIFDDLAIGDPREEKLGIAPDGFKLDAGMTTRIARHGLHSLPRSYIDRIQDALADNRIGILEGAKPEDVMAIRAFFPSTANIAFQGWHLHESALPTIAAP